MSNDATQPVTAQPAVLGLILARGGSSGIPGKNIKPLAGVPLIAYTVAAARACSSIDRVLLSTDSPEIAAVAQRYGAEAPFMRPAELARADSPSMGAVIHALDWLREQQQWEPSWVVLLQPTSPLRRAKHIDDGFAALRAARGDSLVSVVKVKHHPAWCYTRSGTEGFLSKYQSGVQATRRQDLPEVLALNGALYIATPEVLRRGGAVGERCVPLVMGSLESVDLDTPQDWALCEAIVAAKLVELEPVLDPPNAQC